MNLNYPDLIYNGIIICLCLQLIVLGFFKLFSKDIRGIILGVFCFFMASGTIYNYFWVDFNNSLVYNLLLGGYKSLFFGPLIFLYIRLISIKKNKEKIQCIAFFLIPPLFLSLGYVITKFGFESFFKSYVFDIGTVINIILILFYSYCLIIFKTIFMEVKPILKPEIYKRYQIFYLGFIIILLTGGLQQLIISFFGMSQEFFVLITRYISNPLDFLLKGGLIFFVLIESKRIKTFIYGKNIYLNNNTIRNTSALKLFIDEIIFKNKEFKHQNFNLKGALKESGIIEKDLKIYIKRKYNKTYNQFINDLKVKEFKSNLINPNNNVFDIASIAKMSGFTSKATFYRVFKEKEGMTPQEYKQSINL